MGIEEAELRAPFVHIVPILISGIRLLPDASYGISPLNGSSSFGEVSFCASCLVQDITENTSKEVISSLGYIGFTLRNGFKKITCNSTKNKLLNGQVSAVIRLCVSLL